MSGATVDPIDPFGESIHPRNSLIDPISNHLSQTRYHHPKDPLPLHARSKQGTHMNLTQMLTLVALITPAGVVNAQQPQTDSNDQTRDASENIDDLNAENNADNSHSISFSAHAGGTFFSKSDFDNSIGEFGYSAYELGVSASRKVGDAGRFTLGFDAGFINYDIVPSATSVAGDAADIGAEFDNVTTLSLIGMYSDKFDDETSWFIGAGVLSAMESDADFGDSIDWLLTGGVTHKFNDKLELGIGVLVKTQLDDDVLIVPIPQIKYTINDQWSIESERAGLKVNYKASDSINYGIMGEYNSTTFRLDDSHAFASEGVATHRSFPLSFYVDYKPNKAVVVNARVGVELGGELEILDTNGNDVTSQDIDAGIFGAVGVSFRF